MGAADRGEVPAREAGNALIAESAIRFGTSGWRGVLGEEFTFERARAVAAAVARWADADRPGAPVLVGHDTRFLADRAAECVARVLSGAGVRPLRVAGPVATPVASHAVRARGCAAGLLVTASHNPPEYLGLKVVTASGGGAPLELTRRLEAESAAVLAAGAPPEADPGGRPIRPLGAYLRDLRRHLDLDALGRSRVRVFYDALHGTGAGVLDRLLGDLGVAVEVAGADPDPRFGGAAPDPTPTRMEPLARRVRGARGLALGLATDGDADRFAVLDAGGRRLSETEAVALLVDHLARTRELRGGVAISVATGSLVECVARDAGLAVERHPIGFKWLTQALTSGRAEVAGEESGGFAWRPVARDKDGILAGALLVEIAARSRRPLRARLAELERRFGKRNCGRVALEASVPLRAGLARLEADPPARLGGVRAEASRVAGVLRLGLPDGFVIFRASGTEPVVRIYAEACGARALASRLAAARKVLERAGR